MRMIRKMFIITCMLFIVTGCNQSSSAQLPLGEKEAISLMAEKMDVRDWKFSKQGSQYSFSFQPSSPDADGITYDVNPDTGTVYDDTSGGPVTNLVLKDAPNLKDITNGEVYNAEIKKLAQVLLDDNGFIPERGDWFSGGYGDGFVYGDVKNNNKTITIKFDVFTKEWEEIKSP